MVTCDSPVVLGILLGAVYFVEQHGFMLVVLQAWLAVELTIGAAIKGPPNLRQASFVEYLRDPGGKPNASRPGTLENVPIREGNFLRVETIFAVASTCIHGPMRYLRGRIIWVCLSPLGRHQ